MFILATELYIKERVAEGLLAITPEEEELKEGGYLERAREELMRGEASKTDSAFLEYLHQLKGKMEPMGYTIVPLSPDAPAI